MADGSFIPRSRIKANPVVQASIAPLESHSQCHRIRSIPKFGARRIHIEFDQLFIGIDVQDPLPGGHFERRVAGRSEVVVPLVESDVCPERSRYFSRVIRTSGVHDDDFIADTSDLPQALTEKIRLVSNDDDRREQRTCAHQAE